MQAQRKQVPEETPESALAVPLGELETFAEGLDHPEGICLAPNGFLYVGGEAGQIYRVGTDDAAVEIASSGGFMLGLAADAESNIYAIDNAAKTVWRFSSDGETREVFTKGSSERPLGVPNWGAFDSEGNYYLTDSGGWGERNGFIWVVRPAEGRNRLTEVWSRESENFPNGCALSSDEDRLFVAESYPSAIVSILIRSDGSAGDREVLCELGESVPDGVAVTTDGSLVISCYRPDALYVWNERSGLQLLAQDVRGTVLAAPTNAVFMGEELHTIVVPNLGRWHLTRFRSHLRGIPLCYPSRDLIDGARA